MSVLSQPRFAGYAYYGKNGEGFVYTLTSPQNASALGDPTAVAYSTTRARNFFPFLFLITGCTLMVGLLLIIIITFCCRRKVARLEAYYWKLQHAFAEVNDALVREATNRSSAVSASAASDSFRQKCVSPQLLDTAATTQKPACPSRQPVKAPQYASPAQSATQLARAAQPSSYSAQQMVTLPPPAQSLLQPHSSFHAANTSKNPLQGQNGVPTTGGSFKYSYQYNYPAAASPVPMLTSNVTPSVPEQVRVSTGNSSPHVSPPSVTPEQPLRRRTSRVSFIGT